MKKMTVQQATRRMIKEAKETLLTRTRIAVHNQKIAHHLTDKTGVPFFVSDDTWDNNWDAVVEASDYLDDLLTPVKSNTPKGTGIFSKFQ